MRVLAVADLAALFLSPSLCAACDASVSRRAAFCPACEPSLMPESARGPDVAAFEYGGAIARAITRYKYEGQPWLGVALGALAATALARLRRPFDLVTHVPLHRQRLVERGFDQSALLAREVARAADRPLRYALLTRTRRTEQQARMGRAARLQNVSGAFIARENKLIRDRSVLLVDDVRTTGATLTACTGALLAAGVRDVQTLVLARDV
jgi:ComF family protein